MKALRTWLVAAAVGVAALPLLPGGAAADDVLPTYPPRDPRIDLLRVIECYLAATDYYDKADRCLHWDDPDACRAVAAAYYWMTSVCPPGSY